MPEKQIPIKSSILTESIKSWAHDLGFQQVGITTTNLDRYQTRFLNWLDNNFHGEMEYMSRHGKNRYQPESLVPGTLRVISVRMNYLLPDCTDSQAVLNESTLGYVSRYALGRDYHKVMRKRLQKLADKITEETGEFGYRVFVDSAPVLEKPLAEKAGLGWIGKHTNLINQQAGSWFFLGELYTDLPLDADDVVPESHCGTCTSCIEVCPTRAIIEPYVLDARRCISYLTIELKGSIPEEYRAAIGNRIYGCDDCQLVCPWNRFASTTLEKDFFVRHQLDASHLITLFLWNNDDFNNFTEGSAIRRIGYDRWLRNVAIALGNAPYSEEIIKHLLEKRTEVNDMIAEHIDWAIEQQKSKRLEKISQ